MLGVHGLRELTNRPLGSEPLAKGKGPDATKSQAPSLTVNLRANRPSRRRLTPAKAVAEAGADAVLLKASLVDTLVERLGALRVPTG